MTATESLLPEIINDFFNKICQQQTLTAGSQIGIQGQRRSLDLSTIRACARDGVYNVAAESFWLRPPAAGIPFPPQAARL
jgi:hypothetical protein